jgi:ABC-type nitrate/sulfonate/bicarbonate transport system substrate-binding protein
MRWLAVPIFAFTLLPALPAAGQTTKVQVATCARTITAGVAAPFAVAARMGWFKQEGIEVELVPLPGSTDCVKNVATRQVPVALPSVEPLAILRPQGVQAKFSIRRTRPTPTASPCPPIAASSSSPISRARPSA